MVTQLLYASVFCFVTASIATFAAEQQAQPTTQVQRFDELVRADFFAGVAGNTAALDRAMQFIETTLAANPQRADVLVWHGAGLVTRAAQAFEKGDAESGERLWRRGLEEMDRAVAMEPDNVAVLIPRGAVLLETSRTLPDADQAKALLATGVADYEKTLALQAPYFKYLSEHSRGELLFGLAEGQHRLGARDKARLYFDRLLGELPKSEYGSMAAAWLKNPTDASARQRGCVGCHQMK